MSDSSNVHPAYAPDAKPEDRANLLTAIHDSLKRKLGAASPPVDHGPELAALANVAALTRDPNATVIPHTEFAPSTAGTSSSVEASKLNMPVDSATPVNQSPETHDPDNKEAPVSKDGAVLGAAKDGDFDAVNLGAAKKVEQI